MTTPITAAPLPAQSSAVHSSPIGLLLESRVVRAGIPILIASGLLGVYLCTIAPGLTWANGGADGGDLIAAAATGGVAHPTGYPVYLLLARLFQWLPIGSLAFRTNLLSALCTAGAAVLTYRVALHLLVRIPSPLARTMGAVTAALALGLAPLIWSQAVITEVHALNLLFVALLVYLLTLPRAPYKALPFLIGLTQGLAIGNQVLAVCLLPATLLGTSIASQPSAALSEGQPRRMAFRLSPSPARDVCIGVLCGLLSYVLLPLRAFSSPPVNWGYVITLPRLLWLTSASLYQGLLLAPDLAAIRSHLLVWAQLALQQFGLPGLLCAVFGLAFTFRVSRTHLLLLWIAVFYTAFAIFYQADDSYLYLIPTFLSFSLWLGLAVAWGLGQLSARSSTLAGVAAAAIVLYLLGLAAVNWRQVDASHDTAAEDYGRRIMNVAPAGALLLADEDRAVFALWYFHHALRQRPDLIVVADDLLGFDWYRQSLHRTYPDLAIPVSTALPWVTALQLANPDRPACYPYYADAALNCR